MSDIAKWALLAVGIIGAIAILTTAPILAYQNVPLLKQAINGFVVFAEPYLRFGRGLLNYFFPQELMPTINGMLLWIFIQPFFLFLSTITLLIYKWIFK